LYKEQYERVLRWYERFKAYDTGIKHNKPSNNYIDEVYAFFINCYHLKDWLKNDPNINIGNSEIENFVNTSTDLKLCGDICNGIKHLNRKKLSKIGPKHYKLNLKQNYISFKIEIIDNNKKYDAFELATTCIELWKQFLKEHNL